MILILISLIISQGISTPGAVHFFYRPSCGHCMDILLADIPRLRAKYTFTLKKYDIDLLANYDLLERMEQDRGVAGEDLPVIFVDDSVFYGPENAYARMESVLKSIVGSRQKKPEEPTALVDTVTAVQQKGELYYFFQPGCEECGRLEALFNGLDKAGTVVIHRYNILEDTSKILLEALSTEVGIPKEKRLLVPVVISVKGYLIKEEITLQNILKLGNEQGKMDRILGVIDTLGAENRIRPRFEGFSLLGVILAGLLDGVNPCAFATIIFFVSYLLFLGRKRRDIIVMAASFIAAVFIAYFLIGVGAYNLLNYLAGYSIIARIIFLCFGIIALILGLLSLRDYMVARKGHYDKMILQLPLGIKQRIHRDIKERTAVGGIVIGSFIAGLAVSFLEFGCTGQIYLPPITFVISRAGWSLRPMVLLLLYNLMFVFPLVLISMLALLFSTDKIAKSLSARIPAIKLLTAILFFVLGLLLVLSA